MLFVCVLYNDVHIIVQVNNVSVLLLMYIYIYIADVISHLNMAKLR